MPEPLTKVPFVRIANGVLLTGTLQQVGTTFSVANLASAVVQFEYTRNGGSVTGLPIMGIGLSRDPPNTAPNSVANFSRVRILYGASFAAGTIDSYAEVVRFTPTAAGAQTLAWPDTIDVSGWFWLQVLLADADAVNPGTVSVWVGGQ